MSELEALLFTILGNGASAESRIIGKECLLVWGSVMGRVEGVRWWRREGGLWERGREEEVDESWV
jgi:hypothetical protein